MLPSINSMSLKRHGYNGYSPPTLLNPLSRPVINEKYSKSTPDDKYPLTLHPHIPLDNERREEEVETDGTVRVPLEVCHEEAEANKHHYVHFLLICDLHLLR